MAAATIIDRGRDGSVAFLCVEVAEAWGRTEYRGEVPITSLVGLTKPQIRAALVAACKATRDDLIAEQQLRAQLEALPEIDFTGGVTV